MIPVQFRVGVPTLGDLRARILDKGSCCGISQPSSLASALLFILCGSASRCSCGPPNAPPDPRFWFRFPRPILTGRGSCFHTRYAGEQSSLVKRPLAGHGKSMRLRSHVFGGAPGFGSSLIPIQFRVGHCLWGDLRARTLEANPRMTSRSCLFGRLRGVVDTAHIAGTRPRV